MNLVKEIKKLENTIGELEDAKIKLAEVKKLYDNLQTTSTQKLDENEKKERELRAKVEKEKNELHQIMEENIKEQIIKELNQQKLDEKTKQTIADELLQDKLNPYNVELSDELQRKIITLSDSKNVSIDDLSLFEKNKDHLLIKQEFEELQNAKKQLDEFKERNEELETEIATIKLKLINH